MTTSISGSTGINKIQNDAVDIADLSATGTASASTFLRGDNAWADALPSQSGNAGKFLTTDASTASWGPAGKILQVQYGLTHAQVTYTTGAAVSTGVTATITPSDPGNKIIFFATINGLQKDNSSVNSRLNLFVDRDGSLLNHHVQAILWTFMNHTYRDGGFSMHGVDSPSSTSAVVYTIKFSGSDTQTCYVNKDNNSGPSYITLMEIA